MNATEERDADYTEFFNTHKIGDKLRHGCFVGTYVQRTTTKNNSTIWLQRKSGAWLEVAPANCSKP